MYSWKNVGWTPSTCDLGSGSSDHDQALLLSLTTAFDAGVSIPNFWRPRCANSSWSSAMGRVSFLSHHRGYRLPLSISQPTRPIATYRQSVVPSSANTVVGIVRESIWPSHVVPLPSELLCRFTTGSLSTSRSCGSDRSYMCAVCLYWTCATISLALPSDSTICWHSFRRRIV